MTITFFFFSFCLELNLFSVNNIDFVHLEGNRGREREREISLDAAQKKNILEGGMKKDRGYRKW